MVLQQAAADADESHAEQPEQNTGGSDALRLGALPVQGNLGIETYRWSSKQIPEVPIF